MNNTRCRPRPRKPEAIAWEPPGNSVGLGNRRSSSRRMHCVSQIDVGADSASTGARR